jgi:tRNA(Ile)-lysidine synthase
MTLNSIKETFFKDQLNGQIIVACSGGPDSTCLLHLLKQAAKDTQFEDAIICAHFDHRWSPISGKATQILKKLCQELKITFVSGLAKQTGRTSEAQAREERYEFLYTVAQEFNSKAILTAHHQDDQIETFFLRLLRGSGPEGLACIQPVRVFKDDILLLRPLLELPKSELLNYCHKHNLFYHQDPSNKELDIKRNQVRSQLLPLAERIQPGYKEQVINLIQMLKAENNFIEEHTQNLPQEVFHSCREFIKQAVAVQRIILKKLLQEKNISFSFELIESLRTALLANNKMKVSVAKDYYFRSNSIRFRLFKESEHKNKPLEPQPITFNLDEEEINLPGIGQLLIAKEEVDLKKCLKEKNDYRVFVDLNEFADTKLVLRGRLPKDRFQSINSKYSSKLKSFLINRKIKLEPEEGELCRESLLVLAPEGSSDILWVIGVEPSDLVKIKDGGKSTHCLYFIADAN